MPEKNENQKTVRKGREHYNSAILHQKRDQKRIDAEIRDREYQSLSVADRLKRAKSRRGESKREIKRLTKLASVKK
jgi:hypothetical protein